MSSFVYLWPTLMDFNNFCFLAQIEGDERNGRANADRVLWRISSEGGVVCNM